MGTAAAVEFCDPKPKPQNPKLGLMAPLSQVFHVFRRLAIFPSLRASCRPLRPLRKNPIFDSDPFGRKNAQNVILGSG